MDSEVKQSYNYITIAELRVTKNGHLASLSHLNLTSESGSAGDPTIGKILLFDFSPVSKLGSNYPFYMYIWYRWKNLV